MVHRNEISNSASGKTTHAPLFICISLVLVTLAIFWQTRHHGFLNYDDPYYVSGNEIVQKGLTREGTVWAFTRLTGQGTYWHPVTWLSHMLDCELWGVHAGRHHLVTAVLHSLNAVLLFLLLRKLTGALWRSAVVAALFAWHPLQVDSVAWLAERKNILSTLFLILTLFAYSRYVEFRDRRETPGPARGFVWYAITLFLFGIGLMCKPMLVTLPCVLLLLDFWPLKRIDFSLPLSKVRSLVVEKLPFFVFSALSSFITIAAHKQLDLVVSTEELSWAHRLTNAMVAYGLYLGKTIWPSHLAIYYPIPAKWPLWQLVLTVSALLSVSILALRSLRSRPWLMIGWLWFLGTMVPVIGLVQVNDQAMADRFAYVPLIGIFLALVWGGTELLARFKSRPVVIACVASITLAAYAVTAWKQTGHWKSSETVFGHALRVTQGNYVAHNNLARDLMEQGRADEALHHFEEVIKLKYYTAIAHNNIGIAKARRGDLDGAMKSFQEALASDPKHPDVHANMGLAYMHQGRFAEALSHLSEAVRLNPKHAEAHSNLASSLEQLGRYAEAERNFRESMRLRPEQPGVHLALGRLMVRQGNNLEARRHFAEAVRLQPGLAEAEQQLERLAAMDAR